MAFLLPLFLLFLISASAGAHNITHILEAYPEFSAFNLYLTNTHLAEDINSREAVTVLVVENQAMVDVLSNGPPISNIKRVLSLHVLTDYYDEMKLRQLPKGTTTASTLFQQTGDAPEMSGFVNITALSGGTIGFKSAGNAFGFESFFVMSVKEMPFNLSVLQINTLLRSPVAEGSLPSPGSYNLTSLMDERGCGAFGRLVASNPYVENEYKAALSENGLTLFCPLDEAIESFQTKLKNLTNVEKEALLLYHGLPTYYSMPMIRTTSGQVVTTIATHRTAANSGYNFTFEAAGESGITINTRIVEAKLVGQIIDQQPLAMYKVDKVLRPRELFSAPEVESPTTAAPAAPGRDPELSPAGGNDQDASGSGRRVPGNGLLTAAVIAGVIWLRGFLS